VREQLRERENLRKMLFKADVRCII